MQEEKQVKFDKGKVSAYNGQTDLYCDFVTVTQGSKQDVYYLLNDRKAPNDDGYYIVSTVLKEAIDPNILRTHIGLIDKKGNIIIPFTNKSIKRIEGDYFLVVRNEAQSASVKEAIVESHSDNATEKMVSANAAIKDKLNAEMQNHGKFILNDLLSEGSVFSSDGKNILNDKWYSFIGMTGDAFYCATNVPTNPIDKVSRNGAFMEEEHSIVPPIVQPAKEEVKPVVDKSEEKKEGQETLDVSAVSVPKSTIDSALSSQSKSVAVEKTAPINDESVVDEKVATLPEAEEKNDVLSLADSLASVSSEEKKSDTTDLPSIDLPQAEIVADSPKVEVPKVSSPKVEESSSELPNVKVSDSNPTKVDIPEPKVEITDTKPEEAIVSEQVSKVDDSSSTSTDIQSDRSEVEDVGAVVHAVGDLVQQNKELKERNAQLEKSLKEKEAQLTLLPQIQEENKKLTVLVGSLKEQNAQMASGIKKMKSVLSIVDDAEEEKVRVFQKAA